MGERGARPAQPAPCLGMQAGRLSVTWRRMGGQLSAPTPRRQHRGFARPLRYDMRGSLERPGFDEMFADVGPNFPQISQDFTKLGGAGCI